MASTQREPTLPILPPKSSEKSKSKSKSKHKESLNGSQSSIVTFGFETQPRPINLVTPSRPDRPDMPHRRTEDYKGKEDMQISGPYNVRKEGSEISPLVPAARWYNPKTAGYLENQRRIESEKASASRGLDEEARTNVVGSGGPSAGGVTVGDLWPPMSSQGIRNDVDRGESRVEVRKER